MYSYITHKLFHYLLLIVSCMYSYPDIDNIAPAFAVRRSGRAPAPQFTHNNEDDRKEMGQETMGKPQAILDSFHEFSGCKRCVSMETFCKNAFKMVS